MDSEAVCGGLGTGQSATRMDDSITLGKGDSGDQR